MSGHKYAMHRHRWIYCHARMFTGYIVTHGLSFHNVLMKIKIFSLILNEKKHITGDKNKLYIVDTKYASH